MATVNLDRDSYNVNDGLDAKVIIRDLADIPGGRALDCTGFTGVIKAGHIIVRTKATGVCKPLALSGSNYASLTSGDEYLGVLKVSVTVEKPAAAIMTVGEVNAACCPYPVTDTIKAALTQIRFL